MTVTETEPAIPRGLVQRVKNILMRPSEEWAVIDAEPATIQGIYRNWLLYLAAIGPVCMLIGEVVFLHFSIMGSLVFAIVNYALWLAMPYVAGLIIDALAPSFGGEKNRVQAMKIAAYSPTASMVAGVFSLIPPLGVLAIVGLYSLYLLWVGLPRLMRVPADRAVGYFVVVLLAMVGIGVVIGMLMSFLLFPLMLASSVAGAV